MKNRTSYLLILIFFSLLSASLHAQEKVIHGIVTTFDSIPLNGASITVKSSKQVIESDSLGNFSVGVADKDVLVVKAKGFYNQKAKITAGTKIVAVNLNLKPGVKSREYAIGYGYVTDGEKLNALSSLNRDDMNFSQYNSVFDIIRGRFAGVQVINNEIQIRGVNSINLNTNALIILDGITVSGATLNTLSTSNIKSINVIKDGSAAIYGSRGANGVVIVETLDGND